MLRGLCSVGRRYPEVLGLQCGWPAGTRTEPSAEFHASGLGKFWKKLPYPKTTLMKP